MREYVEGDDDLAVCTDLTVRIGRRFFCLSLVMKSRSERRVVMRNVIHRIRNLTTYNEAIDSLEKLM